MKTNAKQLAAARRAMEVIAAREGISVEEVMLEFQTPQLFPILQPFFWFLNCSKKQDR
ncbi:hypothetical protein GPK87_13570 [Oscillibacter sp. MCC667]|nr:hypothetical protein [Oscillibacter sp. MCC667]